MFQYDMLARSLAAGNGFRWYAAPDLARIAPYLHINMAQVSLDPRGMLTTFRAPLYPAFLAVIYALNGINDGRFFDVRLAQAALGALLAPLTYLLARTVFASDTASTVGPEGEQPLSEKASTLAAWAVAVYPMLVIFPLALATENLFFLLVLASVLALLQLPRLGGGRKAVLWGLFSGLLLGLAALTRSIILPFAALALLWIWFSLKLRWAALAAAAALLLTVLPWVVRNSLLEHKLTGIETSMGYNLYVGYYPDSTGTFAFGPSLDLLSILNDGQRDAVGTQKAIAFMRAGPVRVPYLAVRRLGYFFNLELRAFGYFYGNNFLGFIPLPVLLTILLVLSLPFVLLGVSAAFGWALLPRNQQTLLLLLLFTAYLLPHVLILSEERFHLALLSFIATSAAGFWVRGWHAVKSRGVLITGLAFVLIAFLLINWGFQLSQDGPTLLKMLGPEGNQLYLPY